MRTTTCCASDPVRERAYISPPQRCWIAAASIQQPPSDHPKDTTLLEADQRMPNEALVRQNFLTARPSTTEKVFFPKTSLDSGHYRLTILSLSSYRYLSAADEACPMNLQSLSNEQNDRFWNSDEGDKGRARALARAARGVGSPPSDVHRWSRKG